MSTPGWPAGSESASSGEQRLSESTQPLHEQQLWRRWALQGDFVAREQLIGLFLPYARVLSAKLYSQRSHDEIAFDEYMQLASVGLLEAVDRFDPSLGIQFKTFAAKRMQGAILSGLERLTEKNQQIALHRRLKQERLRAVKEQAEDVAPAGDDPFIQPGTPEAKSARQNQLDLLSYLAEVGIGLALGVLLDGTGMFDAEPLGSPALVPSPEVSYFKQNELRELRNRMVELVKCLPPQQQRVIRHHYLQEIPFDEIAIMMEVGRSRVSQLHRQALDTLRQHLAQRHTVKATAVC